MGSSWPTMTLRSSLRMCAMVAETYSGILDFQLESPAVFKLRPAESRSRCHPRRDFRARAAVVEARMAHQRSAHPAVDILKREIVRLGALLQLSHRGDEFQTRTPINLWQRQWPGESS